MASVYRQLFHTHCARSDLGPVSVNWFEELTAEALQRQSRICEDEEQRVVAKDDSLLKTPSHKAPSDYSQLDFTPTIFKEPSLCSPLFLSPTRESYKNTSALENAEDLKPEIQPGDSTQLLPDEVCAPLIPYPDGSPAVMKSFFKTPFWDSNTHKTPQNNRKRGISDSLFCTPKLMGNPTPSRYISESLGAEADPEMSWSSSLATPPSPTVLIAPAIDATSIKSYENKDAVIVQSLFSKRKDNIEEGSVAPKPDGSIESDVCVKNAQYPAKSCRGVPDKTSSDTIPSSQFKKVQQVGGKEETCQGNVPEGMEDILSIFFTNDKPSARRKVKIDSRAKRRTKVANSSVQDVDVLNAFIHTEQTLDIESQKKNNNRENDCTIVPPSYEWSPLTLPDSTLSDTHLPQSNLVAYGEEKEVKSSCLLSEEIGQSCIHEQPNVTCKCANTLETDLSNIAQQKIPNILGNENFTPEKTKHEDWRTWDQSVLGTVNEREPQTRTIHQKAKSVLSALKRQSKFVYCLNDVKNDQGGETREITDPSHTEPFRMAKEQNVGGNQDLSPVSTQLPPNEQKVAKEDDPLGFREKDINYVYRQTDVSEEMGCSLTNTADLLSTVSNGPEIKRKVSTKVGGLNKRRSMLDSKKCILHEGSVKQRDVKSIDSDVQKTRLCSDVMGDLQIQLDSNKVSVSWNPELDNGFTDILPVEENFKSVIKPGDGPMCSNLQNGIRFKTASNKKIHISEENLKKAEQLLKDDDPVNISTGPLPHAGTVNKVTELRDDSEARFRTALQKEILVPENKVAKAMLLFQDIEDGLCENMLVQFNAKQCDSYPELSTSLTYSRVKLEEETKDKVLDPLSIKHLKKMKEDTNKNVSNKQSSVKTAHRDLSDQNINLFSNIMNVISDDTDHKKTEIQPYSCELLTESQKAEVNELSSILENADSQFDFTQFRKTKVVALNNETLQSGKDVLGESQALNNSDVWKDVDFNDSFAAGAENEGIKTFIVKTAAEIENDTVECDSGTVVKMANSLSKDNERKLGANVKGVNISDEDLLKAMEVFSDTGYATMSKQSITDNVKGTFQTGLLSVSDAKECKNKSQTLKESPITVCPKTDYSSQEFEQKCLITHFDQSIKNLQWKTTLMNENKCDHNETKSFSKTDCVQNVNDTSGNGLASPSCLSAMSFGFSTSAGKVIHVGQSSLAKAKAMFADIIDSKEIIENQTPSVAKKTKTGITSILEEGTSEQTVKQSVGCSMQQAEANYNSFVHNSQKDDTVSKPNCFVTENVQFNTAFGNPFQIPKEHLKMDHEIISDVDKQRGLPEGMLICNQSLNKSLLPGFSFSTASGKSVAVSHDSLQKAKMMFAEVDLGIHDGQNRDQCNPTDTPLRALKNDGGEVKKSQENSVGLSDVGFGTASGKIVAVSHDSLQEARMMIAETECDRGHRLKPGSNSYRNKGKVSLDNEVSQSFEHTQHPQSEEMVDQIKAAVKEFVSDTGSDIYSLPCLKNSKMQETKVLSFKPEHSSIVTNNFKTATGKPEFSNNVQHRFDDLDYVRGGIKHKFYAYDHNLGEQKNTTGMPENNVQMDGFRMVGGKPVTLSEEVLKKEKQMFAKIEDGTTEDRHALSEPNVTENVKIIEIISSNLPNIPSPALSGKKSLQNIPPLGFSTARGKPVAVSNSSLQKARLLFAEIDNAHIEDNTSACEETVEHARLNNYKNLDQVVEPLPTVLANKTPHSLPTLGFSTAGGKAVAVSDCALQKARLLFAEINDSHIKDEHCAHVKNVEENHFRTSTKLNLPVTLPISNPTHNLPLLGFSTASGNAVAVSDGALQKARQLFDEINDTNIEDEEWACKKSIEENASLNTSNKLNLPLPALPVNKPADNFPSLGFTKTTVSDNPLPKARLPFADTKDIWYPKTTELKIIETNTKEELNPSAFQSDSGEMNNHPTSFSRVLVNSLLSVTPSFRTAGGKSVTLSEESLRKAQQMFAEVDDHIKNEQRLMQDFEENAKSNVSLDCNLLNAPSLSIKKAPDEPLTSGFSTASGKIVAVSDGALQKARLLFADTEDIEHPNTTGQRKIKENMDTDKLKPSAFHSDSEEVNGHPTLFSRIPVHSSSLSAMPSFRTAGGKSVTLSEESLRKAQLMFAEIDDQEDEQSLRQHYLEQNVKADKCTLLEAPISSIKMATKDPPTLGFSTASGKTVAVSDSALQKARLLFASTEDNIECTEHSKIGTINIEHHEKPAVEPRRFSELQVDNRSVSGMPCFSTSAGKSVTFSEEALKKARGVFLEMDNHSVQNAPGKPENVIAYHLLTKSTVNPSKQKTVLSEVSCSLAAAAVGNDSASKTVLEKVEGFLEEITDAESMLEKPHGNCLYNNESSDNMSEKVNMLSVQKPEYIAVFNKKLGNSHDDIIDIEINNMDKLSVASTSDVRNLKLRHSTPFHNATIPKKMNFGSGDTLSHTPENYFEIEAAESAKAFMDDEELTDVGERIEEAACKPSHIRIGKRLRSDDKTLQGEPAIKRQLLPEFDRSLQHELIQPITSSPTGHLKDRRKFLYNVSLRPLACEPTSFSVEKNNLSAKLAVPKLISRTFVSPFNKIHVASWEQEREQMDPMPDLDQETLKDEKCLYDEKNKQSDFSQLVPILRCARDMQEMGLRKKQRQKIKPLPGSLYRLKASSAGRIPLVAAVQGRRPTMYSKAQLYRFGVLRSHLGVTSETARTFEFNCLDFFTKENLLSGGSVKIADGGCLVPSERLTAGREEFYRALCDTPGVDPKLISPEWVYNHYRWIVWKLALMAVKFPELFANRCLTPERVLLQLKYRYDVEIDKSQRSALKRIMERDDTAAKTLVLCVSRVISYGGGEKSESSEQVAAVVEVTDGWYCIKAMLDTALTALLRRGRLFIGQKIVVHGAELIGSEDACSPLEAPESLMLKGNPAQTKNSLRDQFQKDEPTTTSWVRLESLTWKLFATKDYIEGLLLENCGLINKPGTNRKPELSANSTRPARWATRLGYFHDPRPFCLPISSLFAEGGVVGCVDVLIQRTYPMQWMEKMANGTYTFRNDRAEEREAERHSSKQQKSLETIFLKIQEEFEQQEACSKKVKRTKQHFLSVSQIGALQDGAEIYEALQNESDPGYIESCMSSEQLRALNQHRQVINDKKQAQIQAEFRKAIESADPGSGGYMRREVTPVWKLRIVDYKEQDPNAAYILNIWRPLPDVVSLLKEGCRFKIYHLAASQSKGKADTATVQLTATKKTQFQQLQPSSDVLRKIYTERRVTGFSELRDAHFTTEYEEVDIVGMVVSTHQKLGAAPTVFLADDALNIVAVKFWGDLSTLCLEELTKSCTFIAVSNLRWRAEYTAGIAMVYAGELSYVAANPKEPHLQKAIHKLRQSVQSVHKLHQEAETKLYDTLMVHHPEERRSLALHTFDPHTSPAAGNKFATPMAKSGRTSINPLSTPDRSNVTVSLSSEMDPRTCKKMKGFDYLSRIPSPSPLTPVRPFVSPWLQRAFRPPRSMQKGAGTSEQPILKSKGEFVADEELAMINTQALVSGLDQGRKTLPPESNDTPKTQVTEETPTLNLDPPHSSSTAADSDHTTTVTTQSTYQGRLRKRR